MKSKIITELSELVQNHFISQEVADKIKAYNEHKQNDVPNRLFTVFGVLGSALIGMGIILIVAHNWDNFSKVIKTFFAFLPLIIGQAAVGYSIIKSRSSPWKES